MSIFTDMFDVVAKRAGYVTRDDSDKVLNQVLEAVKSEKNKVNKTPGIVPWPDLGMGSNSMFKTSEFVRAYVGWVYANVKRRAEQMANIRVKLVQIMPDGDTEEVDDHPALNLLYKPNSQMTGRELFEFLYSHLDLAGEAFWMADRGTSTKQDPTSLMPLLPHRIQIVPGDEQSGVIVKGFIYTVYSANNVPTQINLDQSEVVFFKEIDPTKLLRGKGVVEAAARTIDNDDSQEQWSYQFFKHGATAKPMFQTDAQLDKPTLDYMYTQLQQNWSGSENAAKAMILHSGLKLADGAASMSQKDMEFLAGQTWTRDKIMSMFGMTKTILGITEDVNRANAETSEYVFAKYTLIPRVQKILDYLNEYFLPMFKGTEAMFFMIDDPIDANSEALANLYKAALAGGSWMTPNEVRQELGLDPLKGGDVLYQPLNLTSIAVDPSLIDPEASINNSTDTNKLFNPAEHRIRSKMKRERVKKEALAKAAIEAATKIVMAKHQTPIRQLTFREMAVKDGGFVEVINKFARSQEQHFKKAAQEYFDAQRKDVLDNIQAYYHKAATWTTKAPEGKFLFEPKDYETIGMNLFMPLYKTIMQKQGNEAFALLGSRLLFSTDNPRARKFIESQAGDLIKGIDNTTLDKLRSTLSDGVGLGEGIPDLQKRVGDVFDEATDSRAEMIARTETIDASNAASQEAYQESGVVQGKEWLTADDCEDECLDLDGEVVELNADFSSGDNYPPLHPNCRCVILPVTDFTKAVTPKKEKEVKPILSPKQVDKLSKRLASIV